MEEHLTNWSLILLVDYCAYLLPCTSLSIYLIYKRKNILKLLLLNEVSGVLAFALHGERYCRCNEKSNWLYQVGKGNNEKSYLNPWEICMHECNEKRDVCKLR